MAEQHYKGSCQCGAVAYEADVDLDKTVTCNCSRCQRMGFVLSFVTPEKFTLLRGEDALTVYRFNKQVIEHPFCKVCGVESFARGVGPGGPAIMVNVNCLEGVNPRALDSYAYDGASA